MTTKMKFIDRVVKKLWEFYGLIMSWICQPRTQILGCII
ncbi:hypothetical protein PCARR_a3010 [Pseudoalteromonas carrageenovora IAM 12662]|uniref:Transposase n=1 Tax=Pseudoalteromonas carrageenovora IAM 12662 TaxID=1314868 RepID=A0ABR9EN11_PSEVC|nr:hypothetical protein [Pseudoalteromonas carrageenovora IAM 12662]